MNYQIIVYAIEAHVKHTGTKYSAWTIGVTDNPEERRREHGNPTTWKQWNADTEQTARKVESHFHSQGMKGGTGGLGNADYVYIF